MKKVAFLLPNGQNHHYLLKGMVREKEIYELLEKLKQSTLEFSDEVQDASIKTKVLKSVEVISDIVKNWLAKNKGKTAVLENYKFIESLYTSTDEIVLKEQEIGNDLVQLAKISLTLKEEPEKSKQTPNAPPTKGKQLAKGGKNVKNEPTTTAVDEEKL